jgi:hypothetical protein
MRCYARPLACLVLAVSAVMVAAGLAGYLIVTAAVTGAALTMAALLIQVISSRTARSRAASGACTTCRHPCQGEPAVVLIDETSIRRPSWPEAGSWVPGRGGA